MLRGDSDLRFLEQRRSVAALGRKHDRDDLALLAGASGATRAVQVGLVLGRRVDVDHEFDVIHVHPAGGDIRRDEHARVAGREGCEIAVALHLREVAMQVDGGDSRVGELLGELLGVVLGAHEEDAPTGAGGELLDQQALGFDRVDFKHVMCHCTDMRGGFVH